jgi:hypothetical protein
VLRRLTFGLPWALSLVVHASLVAITAALVWRVASGPSAPSYPAVIPFDNPAPIPRTGDSQATPADAGSGSVHPGDIARRVHPPGRAGDAAAPPRPLEGLVDAAGTGGAALHLAPEPIRAAIPPALDTPPVTATGVRFAGLGASTARSVVYVVDASGPMVTSLPAVIQELKRSVSRLAPSQKFGVIIFRDLSEPLEKDPQPRLPGAPAPAPKAAGKAARTVSFMPMLVRATPMAMERLATWLALIEPGGRSNPLDGLRAAVALRPDAVFLLSRGIERSGGGVWQIGREAIMAELDRLNPADARTGLRPITIKTIQFLDEDPTGIMQAIGRAHGTTSPAGASETANLGYRVVRRGVDLEGG